MVPRCRPGIGIRNHTNHRLNKHRRQGSEPAASASPFGQPSGGVGSFQQAGQTPSLFGQPATKQPAAAAAQPAVQPGTATAVAAGAAGVASVAAQPLAEAAAMPASGQASAWTAIVLASAASASVVASWVTAASSVVSTATGRSPPTSLRRRRATCPKRPDRPLTLPPLHEPPSCR